MRSSVIVTWVSLYCRRAAFPVRSFKCRCRGAAAGQCSWRHGTQGSEPRLQRRGEFRCNRGGFGMLVMMRMRMRMLLSALSIRENWTSANTKGQSDSRTLLLRFRSTSLGTIALSCQGYRRLSYHAGGDARVNRSSECGDTTAIWCSVAVRRFSSSASYACSDLPPVQ